MAGERHGRRHRWTVRLMSGAGDTCGYYWGASLFFCAVLAVFWLMRRSAIDISAVGVNRPTVPVATEKPRLGAPLDRNPSTALPTVAAASPASSPVEEMQKAPLSAERSNPFPIQPLMPESKLQRQPNEKFPARRRPQSISKDAPIQPAVETPTAHRVPEAPPPERPKVFRNDKRIDLQALVWAPDAADRFVVINNRLVKEGGTIDEIMVVRINPDDVLLSEGSERWYQEFNIR